MELKNKFKNIFNVASTDSFFASGRVNLIGEHIDYNGGLVFPCIINKGTHAEVAYSNDNKIHIYSTNFSSDNVRTIDLNDLEYRKEDTWLNYIKAVFKYMIEKGLKVNKGLNILIKGTITSGGLSSSASLEILMCKIIKKMYNFDITNLDCVMLSVRVENEYIGVKSGIMDQYAIMMGAKDKATLIDCAKKEHKLVDFILKDQNLLILNTNKKRTLADSKYNERYNECMTALKELKQHINIDNLCDMSIDEFEKNKHYITNDINRKRAKYVVYENERVKKAYKALEKNDLDTFYQLMKESHQGLKNEYEVTGKELDSIVEACNEEGIIGARMTGAGFGGNAICIINKKDLHKIDNIKKRYFEKTGLNADIIIAEVGC